jgi:hypothetical protein
MVYFAGTVHWDAQLKVLAVEVTPEVARLVQGEDAQFTCASRARVAWRRVGGELEVGRHVVAGEGGRVLRVLGVRPEDRGYFECEAAEGRERARGYVRVEVEAREAPALQVGHFFSVFSQQNY